MVPFSDYQRRRSGPVRSQEVNQQLPLQPTATNKPASSSKGSSRPPLVFIPSQRSRLNPRTTTAPSTTDSKKPPPDPRVRRNYTLKDINTRPDLDRMGLVIITTFAQAQTRTQIPTRRKDLQENRNPVVSQTTSGTIPLHPARANEGLLNGTSKGTNNETNVSILGSDNRYDNNATNSIPLLPQPISRS